MSGQAKVPALAGILRQAGFSWSGADEICGALDRLMQPGLSSDDVAGALLAWRRAGVQSALGRSRKRVAAVLPPANASAALDIIDLESGEIVSDPHQLEMFNTADERARLSAELTRLAIKR
jgi:hypothetical protein